jgi:hypothetical protein
VEPLVPLVPAWPYVEPLVPLFGLLWVLTWPLRSLPIVDVLLELPVPDVPIEPLAVP